MAKMRIIVLTALLILAVFGGYSYWNYSKVSEPPYAGSVEKIRIGNIGEYSIFNLIAKENGYFRENGLDAELVEYPSGPPAINDLLARNIDVAIAAEFVGARNIFVNKDLRILASVDKHEDFQMIVRREAGIANPADLKGKKIGVTLQGAGEFFLGRFLSYNGIDPKDVTVINMSPAEMTRNLEEGQIDACVIFNTHTFGIRDKMGDRVAVWPIQRSRPVFAAAYTTRAFISNHPDVPERYLRSLTEAEKYLREHPEESKEILKKTMGYTDGYIEYIWPKFDFGVGLDQEFLLALEDDARFVMKNGLMEATSIPNYLDYIYFDALAKVKPEAVLITH